jgi:hypothetical protein
MTSRKIQYWVIPPAANGEFVACMENVLETYAQPYDTRFPVVCMDEQPTKAHISLVWKDLRPTSMMAKSPRVEAIIALCYR